MQKREPKVFSKFMHVGTVRFLRREKRAIEQTEKIGFLLIRLERRAQTALRASL